MWILRKLSELIGNSSSETKGSLPLDGLFAPEKKANYFARAGHKGVEGWLSSYTLPLVYFIDQFQQINKVRGGVVEIGVYHGRFFIALCLLLRKGEKALAIDVFEEQEFNLDGAGVGDYGIFFANLQRELGELINIQICKFDSLKLDSRTIIHGLDGGRSRLFSIDGCHTAKHTENDLLLASESIVSGGIIILDDFENNAWPGVQEGTKIFFRKKRNVVPIVIAYNKLYLTTAEFRDAYQAYFSEIVSTQTDRIEYIDVFGHKVIRALMPIPEKLFPSEHQTSIDFSSLATDPRRHLLSGWSFSEPWGVWSDGCSAKVSIEAPKNSRGDLCMIIAFHAFVTERNPELAITIHVDMQPVDRVICCFGQEYHIRAYIFPAEQLVNNKNIGITFVISEPKSPMELGVSIDTRRLGVGLRSIFFEERG